MVMEIRICGYLEGSWLLGQEPGRWHALVVLDSWATATRFVATRVQSHLYLRFDDIEQPQPPRQMPTSSAVEQGLQFARGKDRLVVICHAGQGRSAALAYLTGCQELGVAAALALLDPT